MTDAAPVRDATASATHALSPLEVAEVAEVTHADGNPLNPCTMFAVESNMLNRVTCFFAFIDEATVLPKGSFTPLHCRYRQSDFSGIVTESPRSTIPHHTTTLPQAPPRIPILTLSRMEAVT